jgi:hypothetical protein
MSFGSFIACFFEPSLARSSGTTHTERKRSVALVRRHSRPRVARYYHFLYDAVALGNVTGSKHHLHLAPAATSLGPFSLGDRMSRSRSKDTPILTSEARNALEEVSKQIWGIERELEHLAEEDLRAFVREFQESYNMESPLYGAAIAEAERILMRMERHRTGSGAWFAVVEALKFERHDGIGKSEILAQEKCQTRLAAVLAARHLLAEHAAKISEDTAIEGKVISELDEEAKDL